MRGHDPDVPFHSLIHDVCHIPDSLDLEGRLGGSQDSQVFSVGVTKRELESRVLEVVGDEKG